MKKIHTGVSYFMNKSNSVSKGQNLAVSISSQSRFSTGSKKLLSINEETSVFFNSCFDKGHVKELVSWFLNTYGEKPTINFVESLKFVGFQQATKAGISLGIEDLEIPPEKPILITEAHIATHKIEQQSAAGSLTSVEKSQCLIDTWNQTSDLLRQNAINNFRNRNVVNPVYMMAFSGARGNVSQVRQLVAMRGLMADPQGAILEFPIQSNFREGLTITEYLISCYGARKGLVDTALRTATSGYLTRRLVDSAQHAVISMIDCGTNRTNILQGKNLANRLVGRVLGQTVSINQIHTFSVNHIISPSDAKLISKKYNQVLVRSPLTCEATTSVCQLCYGWNLSSGKLVQIGEAVGVIAAQSIGEPGTQLTMRTFHTGGVGVFSDQALKPIFATYKGKIIFPDSIPGHFIRTPHGKIVYMIKYIPTNPEKVFFRVQPVNLTQRDLIIREKDLPPGSLLFVKHGEIVDAKKLIAQASHVKLTKQRLPESSHPVYSPLEGQIFFEAMNLLIEKEICLDTETSKKKFDLENHFSNSKNSGLPDIRRMAKIGSFWIFSAYNQHEIHTMNHFVGPGDLVSRNTILFNYKFYSPSRIQLQKINSQLTFGSHSIQIPIEKISYLKNNYKIKIENTNNGKFLYQKKNAENALLFWYPNINSNELNSTFKHLNPIYTEIFSKLNTEPDLGTVRVPKGTIFNVCKPTPIVNTFSIFNKKILTKNFDSNFVKNQSNKSHSVDFLLIALEKRFRTFKTSINKEKFSNSPFVELGKSGWFFISKAKPSSQLMTSSQRQFFPTGLCFDRISFPKRNVSVKNLNNIQFDKFKIEATTENLRNQNWYNSKNIVLKNSPFQNTAKNNANIIVSKNNFGTKFKCGLIWYSRNVNRGKETKTNPINNVLILSKVTKKYVSSANFFLIQSVSEYSFPTKRAIQKTVANFWGKTLMQNPKNPLFTKQKPTLFQFIPKTETNLQVFTPLHSGWFLSQNLFRIQYSIKNNLMFPNIAFGYQILTNTLSRGLSIYHYNFAIFNDAQKFSFKTYLNKWVLPFQSFSSGTVKMKTAGEFRYKVKKTTGTFISILRNTDILTINNTNPEFARIGKIIRWGQEIEKDYACDHNGQILKKTQTNITLRLGIPILASAHGIIHVFQDDLVFKNQLLITLKSRRLQTEDIVQGIPKIEQLFEARERQAGEVLFDTVHIRLRNAFLRELELLQEEHWSIAVEKSFLEAQQFLVDNIIEAYGNQGVKISEKHVEVIVRQMTSRVRILESGETGLLPGELVQHSWIQKFNKHIRDIGLREATYEPMVLGISKSVLQSESFLLAASFQEVSRVLVRSALSKKRDFLRGLHENVIVGQLIPAGTGLLSQFNNAELTRESNFSS
nr:RNA polymerase beta'' subunit [Chlorella desiccata (nom. nud.)]